MLRTIVITASSLGERDIVVRQIYTNLIKEPNLNLVVEKKQAKVNVYHIENETQILVQTYIVTVIPVVVNISSLDEIEGDISFHLAATIETLQKHIDKLKSLQDRRIKKGFYNEQTFEQLARCLCPPDGEY